MPPIDKSGSIAYYEAASARRMAREAEISTTPEE